MSLKSHIEIKQDKYEAQDKQIKDLHELYVMDFVNFNKVFLSKSTTSVC